MNQQASGGRGGEAVAHGEDSTAEGGAGGDAALGSGGDGGNAAALADRSHALGGRGGRGGIARGGTGGNAIVLPDGGSIEHLLGRDEAGRPLVGPGDTYLATEGKILTLARGGQAAHEGGRGGDAITIGGHSIAVGGQGGEAPQPDGRGGRGGRSILLDVLDLLSGRGRRAHMRWPYYEPVTEPGRGGDALDSPQYKARRLIVEQLKKVYFARHGLSLDEAWWDRDVVPLAWINSQLEAEKHRWRMRVVDDEYEFFDV